MMGTDHPSRGHHVSRPPKRGMLWWFFPFHGVQFLKFSCISSIWLRCITSLSYRPQERLRKRSQQRQIGAKRVCDECIGQNCAWTEVMAAFLLGWGLNIRFWFLCLARVVWVSWSVRESSSQSHSFFRRTSYKRIRRGFWGDTFPRKSDDIAGIDLEW